MNPKCPQCGENTYVVRNTLEQAPDDWRCTECGIDFSV